MFHLVIDVYCDDFLRFVAKEDVQTFRCRGNKKLLEIYYTKTLIINCSYAEDEIIFGQ